MSYSSENKRPGWVEPGDRIEELELCSIRVRTQQEGTAGRISLLWVNPQTHHPILDSGVIPEQRWGVDATCGVTA